MLLDVVRYQNYFRINLPGAWAGVKNMAPPRTRQGIPTRQQTKRRLSRYLYVLCRFG